MICSWRPAPYETGVAAPLWIVPASLLLPLFLLQAGGAPLRLALRFDRQAILNGEVWRLFTAHFVHLGWAHTLLNAAGLGLCLTLAAQRNDPGWWWRHSLFLSSGISLALLGLSPSVTNYVGLSGVLYGLFVLVLWPKAGRDPVAAFMLVLLVARLAWQWQIGASPDEERLIRGQVIGVAHAYGAALGLALCVLARLKQRSAP